MTTEAAPELECGAEPVGGETGGAAAERLASVVEERLETSRVDPIVPRKYTPAPNERLLVPHSKFAEEFDRLVQAAVDAFGCTEIWWVLARTSSANLALATAARCSNARHVPKVSIAVSIAVMA